MGKVVYFRCYDIFVHVVDTVERYRLLLCSRVFEHNPNLLTLAQYCFRTNLPVQRYLRNRLRILSSVGCIVLRRLYHIDIDEETYHLIIVPSQRLHHYWTDYYPTTILESPRLLAVNISESPTRIRRPDEWYHVISTLCCGWSLKALHRDHIIKNVAQHNALIKSPDITCSWFNCKALWMMKSELSFIDKCVISLIAFGICIHLESSTCLTSSLLSCTKSCSQARSIWCIVDAIDD